ncbi:MAG: succinylglutamate desuccinylase, partial [Spongiibacteraceae bacterium]
GGSVTKGSLLAVISDPLADSEVNVEITASEDGIVIGRTFLPMVYEGDALYHIAKYRSATDAALDKVNEFIEAFEPDSYSQHVDPADEPPIAG